MARGKSEETKRKNTRKNLENMLIDRKVTGQIFFGSIDEYMNLYDSLICLNKIVKNRESTENMNLKAYTDALREKRMVAAEMRSILNFLGLKPEPDTGGGEPEEL